MLRSHPQQHYEPGAGNFAAGKARRARAKRCGQQLCIHAGNICICNHGAGGNHLPAGQLHARHALPLALCLQLDPADRCTSADLHPQLLRHTCQRGGNGVHTAARIPHPAI